ncbi:MAG: MFS transporter [Novosphingobium sp.]|nr:MFS transporter [Novosphingobium sp.]
MTSMEMTAGAEWRKHWPLVSATTAGMALASMLTAAFGVMLEPIEAEFGWTRAQITSGPAVVSMMGLVLAAPAGYLIDRLGARKTGLLVVFVSMIAIAAISMASGLWQWWMAWAIFGIPAAFTSTVWLAPVSTVFNKGRGMAIAITIAGTGISSALVPPIAEYFVQNHDWRMGYLALGAIWCSVALVLVFAFVPSLKLKTDDPASDAPGELAGRPLVGLTPRQGFRSANFYFLYLASLTSALTGVALILNLVPVLTFTGLGRTQAVAVAGTMGVASVIGRFVGGWLMDRYDVRRLAIGACFVSVLFPITLLAFPGNFWAAGFGLIAYGLTGGMKMNAVVYLTSTHLGLRSFGLFYGAISTTTTVAMGIAPLAANYIYDQTQSYTPVIWAAVPGFLASALLFFAIRPAPDMTGTDPA